LHACMHAMRRGYSACSEQHSCAISSLSTRIPKSVRVSLPCIRPCLAESRADETDRPPCLASGVVGSALCFYFFFFFFWLESALVCFCFQKILGGERRAGVTACPRGHVSLTVGVAQDQGGNGNQERVSIAMLPAPSVPPSGCNSTPLLPPPPSEINPQPTKHGWTGRAALASYLATTSRPYGPSLRRGHWDLHPVRSCESRVRVPRTYVEKKVRGTDTRNPALPRAVLHMQAQARQNTDRYLPVPSHVWIWMDR